MGSEQNRYPLQERAQKRWSGCWGGLACFGTPKGGKRIVPSSRIPEGNASSTHQNGGQGVGFNNGVTSLIPSLLAPPSSPASFSNSAVPSTAHSPTTCFLTNSPACASSAMFVTGPYAHETQLVSPPVFSTEPSTAPLTPPPEAAHLTTPSSPDVPFAQFLSSSADRNPNYSNDLRAAYSLYPGSPALSRTSSSFPERDIPSHWESPDSPKNPWAGTAKLNMVSQDTNFFCPDTYARFYLDPHSGGRLSVSKESDVYSCGGGGGWYKQSCKADVEEMEAYRASFGFSADEIMNTPPHVVEEICDGLEEDSFTMRPLVVMKDLFVANTNSVLEEGESNLDHVDEHKDEELLSGYRRSRHIGLSCSDAEIDYRKGSRRNVREGKGAFQMT